MSEDGRGLWILAHVASDDPPWRGGVPTDANHHATVVVLRSCALAAWKRWLPRRNHQAARHNHTDLDLLLYLEHCLTVDVRCCACFSVTNLCMLKDENVKNAQNQSQMCSNYRSFACSDEASERGCSLAARALSMRFGQIVASVLAPLICSQANGVQGVLKTLKTGT